MLLVIKSVMVGTKWISPPVHCLAGGAVSLYNSNNELVSGMLCCFLLAGLIVFATAIDFAIFIFCIFVYVFSVLKFTRLPWEFY